MMQNFSAPNVILLLGDSIAQYGDRFDGFATILRDKYAGRYIVLNLGISGLNSRQYLEFAGSEAFASVIPQNKASIKYIIYEIGANDAAVVLDSNEQYVEGIAFQSTPPEEYRENLTGIHAFLTELFPVAQIVFVAPPPNKGREGRHPQAAHHYAELCREAAAEAGAIFIDPRLEWKDSMLADGLHLSAEGNAYLAQLIADVIGEGTFWRANWRDWK